MGNRPDYCLILAGGVGKRLWPCSRKAYPKQFLDFFGTGRSLLQQTYDRVVRLLPPEHIYISTYEGYKTLVHQQLPDLPEAQILAEPVQLSTAPAVAWASFHIANIAPEANLIVTPADHMIADVGRFEEQLRLGLDFVGTHAEFLAIGAKPGVPNTNYGYIQMAEETIEAGLHRVKSFTEKPDAGFARLFVESGEFLWNTGLFLFNLRTMKAKLQELAPVISERISAAGGNLPPERELALVKVFYPSNLHQVIDLVILEKCDNVCVMACDFGWADVGSWTELRDLHRKDADGNAVVRGGKVLFEAAGDNLVDLPSDMAAVIAGLKGYLVAQRDGVLVICPDNDPALVRRLMNEAQMQLGEDYV